MTPARMSAVVGLRVPVPPSVIVVNCRAVDPSPVTVSVREPRARSPKVWTSLPEMLDWATRTVLSASMTRLLLKAVEVSCTSDRVPPLPLSWTRPLPSELAWRASTVP